MQGQPTREQLQEALQLAGIQSMPLDQALSDPILSRLLHIGASAMAAQAPIPTSSRTPNLPAWAKRLRHMAGQVDYQRLRAGDRD